MLLWLLISESTESQSVVERCEIVKFISSLASFGEISLLSKAYDQFETNYTSLLRIISSDRHMRDSY